MSCSRCGAGSLARQEADVAELSGLHRARFVKVACSLQAKRTNFRQVLARTAAGGCSIPGWLRPITLGLSALLPFLVFAHAAQASDFYRDKQITFVVSADAGGSFDAYARLIARFLPKHIPGDPAVLVQNMPGAGGLRAANWLYNLAPKDGLTIGLINTNIPFDPMFGEKSAQFVAENFNWLGSPNKETGTFLVWHTVPVDSITGARSRRLFLSATGAGSTPAFFARLFASIFDLKIKIIPGYKSQSESFLAMERGENDGNASSFWSSLTWQYPDWIRENKLKVLVYYGALREPEIPGPYFFDLVSDPGKRKLMEIAQASLTMGRPMLMPPGVDAAKVTAMRAALDSMFADPAYQDECAREKLNCRAPSTGMELLGFVRHVYGLPQNSIAKIAAIYAQGQ
jgi:tripartite-type tricarboxylate transporter receptor subunit TctC